MPLQLSTPVKFIKRIGERVASNLAERGVLTVEDLLYHLPFRYENRLHPKPLSLYNPGDMASLIGEVRGTTLLRTRSGPIFEMTVGIFPPAITTQHLSSRPTSAPTQTPSSHPQSALNQNLSSRPKSALTQNLSSQPTSALTQNLSSQATSALTQNLSSQPTSALTQNLSSRPESALFADAAERSLHSASADEASMAGLLAPPPPIQTLAMRSPSPSAQAQSLSPSAQDILQTVKCMWFHGTYLKDKFRPGQSIALYGKLEGSRSGNILHPPPGSSRFKMIQPTFEILPDAHATGEDAEFTMLEMGRIVPVYESLGGKTPWGAKLTSRWMRRIMWTIFRELAESAESSLPIPLTTTTRSHSPSAQDQDETLPTSLRTRLSLPTRMDALRDLHFPPAGTSITELMSARTPAHRRLIFEEFWYLELGLELKRRRLRERPGTPFVTNDSVREALKQILPFKPTAAQKRVLSEIVTDMRSKQPMRRLLQGDVGSGKTIVAFQAALVAIENGYQVALMAPTEILATQHYLSARKLLGEKISPRTQRPYRIALLTGSLDDRTKRDTRNRIFRGEVDLAIGTHALVEANVDFANLGLVIVDEQHRFGVQQRFQLMRKPNAGNATQTTFTQPPNTGAPSSPTVSSSAKVGIGEADLSRASSPTQPPPNAAKQIPPPSAQDSEPDVLVMTATPIPRTLALTLYGDLEVSVIDELPPGRSPILTRRVPEERSAEVWDFIRKQAAAGHQTYIVYPIIEGANDDQPELDFAKSDEDLSQKSSSDETDESTTPPSAGGALYTSVGRSPTKAPKVNQRAGGPTHKPTTKARAKASTPRTRTKLRSATEMHEDLQQGPLAGLKLGLLHGRMSPDDKEITMARFKRGELDVLVSTTVIEVGVDVPNATLMVIEHAERFGLAQLHQLRGRVGRGAAKSFCILLTGASISPEAELRLDAMVRTQNGFELAEVDLQQRGPGEFFGTRQAGLPEFRVANLARDRDLLELAKIEAAHFVDHPDPTMPRPEIDAVWSRLKLQWQRRYGLLEA